MRPICANCCVTRSSSVLFQAGESAACAGHAIRQFLHPQHRFDARNQRRLIDRLGQVFVGASLKAEDDILGVGFCGHQNDRHERQVGVRLQPAADFEAVELRHHHVEQDQVGQLFAGDGKRFLAIASLQQLR